MVRKYDVRGDTLLIFRLALYRAQATINILYSLSRQIALLTRILIDVEETGCFQRIAGSGLHAVAVEPHAIPQLRDPLRVQTRAYVLQGPGHGTALDDPGHVVGVVSSRRTVPLIPPAPVRRPCEHTNDLIIVCTGLYASLRAIIIEPSYIRPDES